MPHELNYKDLFPVYTQPSYSNKLVKAINYWHATNFSILKIRYGNNIDW